MKKYRLPRVFIEKELYENESHSYKHVLVFYDNKIMLTNFNSIKKGGKILVEEIYDDAYKYFLDLENSIICNDVCIMIDDKALLLSRGDKVFIKEFVGKDVIPLVSIGEKVESYSRLVTIFTGKHELRYGISGVSGIIFYFTQTEYKPQKFLFVVSKNVVMKDVIRNFERNRTHNT
ncbi:MAG: DUF2118 domain-containing protein [Candidatus Methanomethylicia archaeon]